MSVRLAELLGGLSLACDRINAFAPGKAQRTAIVASRLGRVAGLAEPEVRDAYFLSLLRYLGCVGFAHEEAHRYGGGDDHSVRSVMALADVSDPLGTLRSALRGIAPRRPFTARVGAISRLLSDGAAVTNHARAQCETSIRLSELIGVGAALTASLRFVCERWDGRGEPRRVAEGDIPIAMRVHHVADVAEIAFHRGGLEAARGLLAARAGGQLDPRLAERCLREVDAVFSGLDGPVWQGFLDAEPPPHAMADDAGIDAVALALARFTDLKTVYTLGHSEGVAALAERLARSIALPPSEIVTLRRAALLHDLGRVGVSNAVWDHPGPLDAIALEEVRMHTYYTERALHQSPSLRALAPVAAGAHERLDGGGYHRGVPAAVIPRAARVLAVADACAAMGEERPHRKALSRNEIERSLREDARASRLDRELVDAALAALGVPLRGARPSALTARELEVLRLVARGKTNKEIAAILGISARTVQVHVGHGYDKAGVSCRAGAALYMVERGLIDEG